MFLWATGLLFFSTFPAIASFLLHLLLNLLLHLLDDVPLLLIGIDANGMWSGKKLRKRHVVEW